MNLVDEIMKRVDAKLYQGLTDEALKLAEILKMQVPQRSGELMKTIQVIPAARENGAVRAWVTIGDKKHNYAYAVWKGIQTGQPGSVHKARPGGVMRFEDWPNGPSNLRHADGFFYFKRVTHNSPANDYVERTLVRYAQLPIENGIAKKIKVSILK